MSDPAQRWNTWASISTVIAAVIAAISFAWGAKSELDAARAQALGTAMQIVQSQTQLAIEYPDLAIRDPDDATALADPRYVWFATNALIAADSIYGLVGDDPDWQAAAITLVQQHLPFVFSPEFPCDIFGPEFLRLVREETQEAATQRGVTVCPED